MHVLMPLPSCLQLFRRLFFKWQSVFIHLLKQIFTEHLLRASHGAPCWGFSGAQDKIPVLAFLERRRGS